MRRQPKYVFIVPVLMGIVLMMNCKSPAEPDPNDTTPNQRPVLTSITGPVQVVAGQAYEYEAVGYDPDGSQIRYHFGTWPDGKYNEAYTNWGYTEFFSNNTTGKMTLTFNDLGTCYLCCHCVDDKGLDSQPHTIITIQVATK